MTYNGDNCKSKLCETCKNYKDYCQERQNDFEDFLEDNEDWQGDFEDWEGYLEFDSKYCTECPYTVNEFKEFN